MTVRRLLVLLLSTAALCGCSDAVPPGEPVATPTPQTPTPRGYVDPGYGICHRLDLPSLVRPIATPGRVIEEAGEAGRTDWTCLLGIGSPQPRPEAGVSLRIVIGGPFGAELAEGNEPGMIRAVEPISGWWTEGARAVSRSISTPPTRTQLLVNTVIEDRDLWVDIWIRNPRVRGDRERQATTRLGEAILHRLQDHLTLEPVDEWD